MKIFENSAASRLFYEMLEAMPSETVAKSFSARVNKLFLDKSSSEEELDSYKVTVNDLLAIGDEIVAYA